ncbi:MAG: adenylate/guanylate cyclase domain-containing protein [Elusimicrobiales bacterium]|nr:adenylate/guanylate cyclase domain-containing protein [Elusimicrobiales bacterium]
MFGNAEKAERKKKLEEFFGILIIPFALALVGTVFSDMAFTVFTGTAPQGRAGLGFGVGGLSFGLMWIFVALWGRPAYLYLEKPDEALKEKIRRRLANVYRDGLLMVFMVQALALVPSFLAPGLLTAPRLGASAVSLLAQVAMLVVYIDVHLAKQKTLMQSLYSGPELYHLRGGFTIPVYLKLTVMIAGFAILPFVLIYIAFFNRVPWEVLSSNLVFMLGISAVMLGNGLTSVYNGVQKPLDGLIDKMKRVAGGDYAKSRIYFSDEVAYLKAGFNDMVTGLKEREELQDTFGKYMSIEIARELIHNKKVNLGGENMEAAVMFCDIRNFTPLSETMSASSLVDFLNKYFHYITPPIAEHNGVINKFIGDAVMAIYTPALGSDDFAADAVRAAIGMRAALAEFNASSQAPGKVEFGIGVHCGKLVAGNIGTAARLEYTFIGDTVNIASRLESKTKDLNTDIVVSATALERARASLGAGIKFEPLGKVALKGKSEELEIYRLA